MDMVIFPPVLGNHIESSDAEIDAALVDLGENIARALERHLDIRQRFDARAVLPGVRAVDGQPAAAEERERLVLHALAGHGQAQG